MKSSFDNWSDIRVFLAVCREGSTLAASKTLGMSQPTVARRIDALEHALELTLFERETRGFRPTEYACNLLPQAEAIEAAVSQMTDVAQGLARPQPIRITAFAENLQANTIGILSEFNQDYPDVRFEFEPSPRALDLKAGEADVAIRLAFVPPDPELIQRKVSVAQFSVYGTQAYADRHGLPKSVEDLAHHDIVSFRRTDSVGFIDNWLHANVPAERIVRTFSEVDLMNADIRNGRALGLVNVRMARDHPEFIQCFDPPKELDVDHLILVAPEAWRRPEVKAFIKFFAPRYAARFRK